MSSLLARRRASWLGFALILVVVSPLVALAADVPVKQVVLFSSGVGYFEHFGTVTGDGSTELRFQTEQINDVLKSLVLQDLDGGRAGTVSYPSQEPIDRALRSFQVDITANPGLEDLLNQLRGATLTANTAGGPIERGTIVGVQKRQTAPVVTERHTSPAAEVWVLNVKVGRVIRSVPMDDLKDFALDDAKLDAELDRALMALAQSRDQDKKPVTIGFRGQGERRVRIGYVVETPVWKTSYRLILDDPKAEKEREPGAGGKLQGWAIIENQTDSDWTDVQLSLVSGRPISFIQQLYRPLYVPRPVVWPELYASLRPQTYKGGMTPEELKQMKDAKKAQQALRDGDEEAMAEAPNFSLDSVSGREDDRNSGGGGLFGGSGGAGGSGDPIDAASSVIAGASAGQLGELFEYTVGNVTLPRQRSAMIPIVTDAIEVERVSIYNGGVLEGHPLNGARVKNTTGKHLLQGPVTVLDAGAYAGDARIDDIPPGQERYVSYGVDLQVDVQAEYKSENGNEGTLATARIVKGVVELRRTLVSSVSFVAQNRSSAAKTIVFELPIHDGYTLKEPAEPDEKTAEVYRFRRPVAAGQGVRMKVVTERMAESFVKIAEAKPDALEIHAQGQGVPPAVRDALVEITQMQRGVAGLAAEIAEAERLVNDTTAEQQRIRENMTAVSDKSEYYQRLLKKLDEQETFIESRQAEIKERKAKLAEQRERLQTHIAELNVG